ncbi:hypothetical protein GP486_003332 [Trichoglossum hirsutum]|uniref:NACHT domain-containing protein n=1 Tax=Trichoglossum hirsutum TaxID=265104 RepID=A0A9P8LDG8_9PEZI|nr:hypothetical protein GP486_003332 [Trichoglossum hirsutum]
MASRSFPTDPWTIACFRYQEDLSEAEKKLFNDATPENLLYSASALQKHHEMGSKTHAIAKKLKPFLDAIEALGAPLDVFKINPYLAPICGGIRVLLQIARGYGKYFDKIAEMIGNIGDIIPRFQGYEELFSDHRRLVHALSAVYVDIMTFCMDIKSAFRNTPSGNLRAFKATCWQPLKARFETNLDNIRVHSKVVEREALLSHMKDSKKHMLEAAKSLVDTHAEKSVTKQRQREEVQARLLSYLSTIKYETKHRKCEGQRHPGTGAWLFKAPEFELWASSPQSTCLWCYGIPGSGKTILASSAIDELHSEANADTTAIIYYYCDYSDPKTLNASSIIGTLIQQLLLLKGLTDEIEIRIEQAYVLGLKEPLGEDLFAILDLAVKIFSKAFIVVDGLDECPAEDQATILSLVNHLTQSEDPLIRILIFSREESRIALALSAFPCLHITAPSVHADVTAFVEKAVAARILTGELKIKDPKLEQVIISALIDGAQGMFLWVRFQLEDLCEAASDAEIYATLQHLPNGLTETYTKIIKKIKLKNGARWEMAIKVFKWVVYAKRPLSKDELAEAVAFDSSDTSWNEKKIPDPLRTVQSCGNLIVLDEMDDTVRLAHHTVRQYLLLENGGNYLDSFYGLLAGAQAEIDIGATCVAYLSFSDFERQLTRLNERTEDISILQKAVMERMPATTNLGPIFATTWNTYCKLKSRDVPTVKIEETSRIQKTSSTLQKKYRLLGYAVAYWPSHTSQYPTNRVDIWVPFRDLSLGKPMVFNVRPWDDTQRDPKFHHMGMFCWAVQNGHEPFLEVLLNAMKGSSEESLRDYYNVESSSGRSPMLVAAANGHLSILSFFQTHLRTSIIADIAERKLFTTAAALGQTELVRTLLRFPIPIEEIYEAILREDANIRICQEIFVAKSADLEANSNGIFPRKDILELAAGRGFSDLIRALLAVTDRAYSPNYRRTCVGKSWIAALKANHSIIAQLIEDYTSSRPYDIRALVADFPGNPLQSLGVLRSGPQNILRPAELADTSKPVELADTSTPIELADTSKPVELACTVIGSYNPSYTSSRTLFEAYPDSPQSHEPPAGEHFSEREIIEGVTSPITNLGCSSSSPQLSSKTLESPANSVGLLRTPVCSSSSSRPSSPPLIHPVAWTDPKPLTASTGNPYVPGCSSSQFGPRIPPPGSPVVPLRPESPEATSRCPYAFAAEGSGHALKVSCRIQRPDDFLIDGCLPTNSLASRKGGTESQDSSDADDATIQFETRRPTPKAIYTPYRYRPPPAPPDSEARPALSDLPCAPSKPPRVRQDADELFLPASIPTRSDGISTAMMYAVAVLKGVPQPSLLVRPAVDSRTGTPGHTPDLHIIKNADQPEHISTDQANTGQALVSLIRKQAQALDNRSNLITEMYEAHLSKPLRFQDSIRKFNHAFCHQNCKGRSPNNYIQSSEPLDQLDSLKESAAAIEETCKVLFIESNLLRTDVSQLQDSIRALRCISPGTTATPEQLDKTPSSMPRSKNKKKKRSKKKKSH